MTTTLASILPDKESIKAVRAIHDSYGRDAAVEILHAFQTGFVVSAKLEPRVEIEAEVPAKRQAQGHVQGRLL